MMKETIGSCCVIVPCDDRLSECTDCFELDSCNIDVTEDAHKSGVAVEAE